MPSKRYLIAYEILIITTLSLIIHEIIVLSISAYISCLGEAELLKVITENWYINFNKYLVNYNSIKTLLFAEPMFFLIIVCYKQLEQKR